MCICRGVGCEGRHGENGEEEEKKASAKRSSETTTRSEATNTNVVATGNATTRSTTIDTDIVAADDVSHKRLAVVSHTSLLNKVEAYQSYLEDNLDLQDTLTQKIQQQTTDTRGLNNACHGHYGRMFIIDEMYEFIKKLGEDYSTASDCLRSLLERRRNYIQLREQSVGNWIKAENGGGWIPSPPTSDLLFDILNIHSRKETKELNDLARETSIKAFELMNSLICDVFTLCNRDELPEDIRSLLCDSVQLHSILAGKISEPEHPD